MVFQNLSLFNFKNFEELKLDFGEGFNFLVGKNGVGKTNILDALHYLSMTKSFINSVDSSNIRFGESGFMIKANALRADHNFTLLCGTEPGKKKLLTVNKKEYDKLSEHIGQFPTVIISPNDNALIYEASETRRRFFDSAISQQDHEYLYALLRYTKALKHRNALLKQFSEQMQVQEELLEPYNNELIINGRIIYERRQSYITDFLRHFSRLYAQLSGGNEEVDIVYKSIWEDDHAEDVFRKSIKKDLILQRTSIGIHKDTFDFLIGDKPLKRHGSQGQQKSFLIALKLGQFEEWITNQESKPVLILDDIFDKLDDSRMQSLLKIVASDSFGQIFVSDARPERTRQILKENNLEGLVIELEQGKVKSIEEHVSKEA